MTERFVRIPRGPFLRVRSFDPGPGTDKTPGPSGDHATFVLSVSRFARSLFYGHPDVQR